MNRAEFITYISEKNKCSTRDAKAIVSIFSKSIIEVLSHGHEVSIKRFGTFQLKKKGGSVRRDPRNQEKVMVAKSMRPWFKAGSTFRSAVKENCPSEIE